MSVSGCRRVTAFLTELFEQPEIADQLRSLRASGATRDQYIDLMAGSAESEMAGLIRDEFGSLPPLAVTTLVDAWAMADFAGKTLEVASVSPDEPMVFARNRRVRITIDAEEDRVTVGISHIPSRHAEWYAGARASA